MKKLKTTIPNGGAPLGQFPVLRELFDIETKEAIEALLNSVLDGEVEGVILSGCVVSGTAGNFAISAGFIYCDGEVLRYDGGSGFSTTKYLRKATVTEEGGVFADTVTRNYIDVHEAAGFNSIGAGQYVEVTFANGGRTLNDLIRRQATETAIGMAEIATQTETDAGTDDLKIVTPLKLRNSTATTARPGVIEIADSGEVDNGTDDLKAVTPKKLKTIFKTATGSAQADIITFSIDTDGMWMFRVLVGGHLDSDSTINGIQENILYVRRLSGVLTIQQNVETGGAGNGGSPFTFSYIISGTDLIVRGNYISAAACDYQAELHYTSRGL